ncbi:MAG: LapA family protein [Candidatus Marinimicrobia bacterium]|nr:LapA family protein [Candidatus Neomarinimicrobiota bacterium]MCF7829648.1 LapA family protein [Candidatus Neomarinimicrobiota bacterium]MCF7879808.1 LapA family protein [Candidatus Neomarinimicrobiota bacterium]
MKTWKIITTLVVAVLVLIVVLQNTAAVETRILFFTLTLPRALLLFLTFLVGFILGLVVMLTGRRQK